MTKHELASFALKLLGIYAIIESLPLLQALGGLVAGPSDREFASMYQGMLLGTLFPFMLMVLTGGLLLAYSRQLAPRLRGSCSNSTL